MTIQVVILLVLLGLVTGFIAKNKGYSFGGWWVYGVLLCVVALPHALMLKTREPGMIDPATSTRFSIVRVLAILGGLAVIAVLGVMIAGWLAGQLHTS